MNTCLDCGCKVPEGDDICTACYDKYVEEEYKEFKHSETREQQSAVEKELAQEKYRQEMRDDVYGE